MGILEENNLEITVIEYLINSPSIEEIKELLSKLDLDSEGLMRKKQESVDVLACL